MLGTPGSSETENVMDVRICQLGAITVHRNSGPLNLLPTISNLRLMARLLARTTRSILRQSRMMKPNLTATPVHLGCPEPHICLIFIQPIRALRSRSKDGLDTIQIPDSVNRPTCLFVFHIYIPAQSIRD